ncbi:hypothetical protein ANRL1_04587 [Anaerolineae bacterium]|nr:hypothetical protein ANRL1_04587 [Anaerolineae bacterium]
MELQQMEERIQKLEHEIKTLKFEIQKTLVEIQKTLPEKPVTAARWQKKAWVLALVNMLIAIVLFSNIYLYIPGSLPFALDATAATYLRAFWIALAFVWLILQMYPLALLLEQQDPAWQELAWHNAVGFFRDRPDVLVLLTGIVLLVGIVNTFVPAAWLVLALVLLLAAGGMTLRHLLERRQV